MQFNKLIKKLLLGLLALLLLFTTSLVIFMQQKIFGKNPSGERLARILKSPNYKNGEFLNIEPTEVQSPDASYWKMFKDFLNKPITVEPQKPLLVIKTDLMQLTTQARKHEKPHLVWFGHSGYLLTFRGINVLVDPVLSGYASPISFFGKAFSGTDIYKAEDLPPIDILIITHDHYDHLDYETLVKIYPKVKKIYTALGVGSHLEYWGIDSNKIVEFDWWDSHAVSDSIRLTALPSRHFSGRSLARAKTLWTAFALQFYDYQLFIGGDSGYDNSFKQIGEKFGGFDLALLESGQYNDSWRYIHMFPEQTVQAAIDLKAKVLFPVHWGKFALGYHAWNEPIQRIVKRAKEQNVSITTPQIGEIVVIDSIYPQKVWWE